MLHEFAVHVPEMFQVPPTWSHDPEPPPPELLLLHAAIPPVNPANINAAVTYANLMNASRCKTLPLLGCRAQQGTLAKPISEGPGAWKRQ
jgi:hypothetical protein